MIHYILQTLAFQLLFLVVYDLFLKKETFFNWNRAYLLLTSILSFILPLIKIDAIQQNIPKEFMIQLPAVIIGGSTTTSEIASENLSTISLVSSSISMIDIAKYIWVLGACLSLIFLGYKLYKIIKLKQQGTKTKVNGLTIITLPKTDEAFTFFNNIFLGESLTEEHKTSILLHEKVHVNEFHTLDLLFFEAIKVLCWFNPLIYVYQNKMVALQEYTADAKVATLKDKKKYYQDLLSHVFQTQKISFINTFFNHSLIKNRIVMLQKSKSKKIFQLKYLLLLPVVCVMLIYTSCAQENNEQETITTANSTSNQVDVPTSEIMQNIDALREAIAAKGEMTPEEEKSLKALMVLVGFDGISNNPEIHDELGIPFGVIEKAPTFKECTGDAEAIKLCTSKKISEYVGANFNTKIGNDLGLTGRQRISVQFKIDKTGNIKDLRARAEYKELENEAIRVVSGLPKMIPGEQEGNKVSVIYSLPIIFEINE